MFNIPKIVTPNNEDTFLLHSCCAPCSTAIIEACVENGITPTIFYYNPNIHPRAEYELRKSENQRFAKSLGLNFIDGDYDVVRWKAATKGQEHEPERGARCQTCFDLRLATAAQYAHDNGFTLFATTLASSRWKNLTQITQAGELAAQQYDNLTYWTQDWRKQGLSNRKEVLIKDGNYYQQEYCGCCYSLRDSNKWREENGRPLILLPHQRS